MFFFYVNICAVYVILVITLLELIKINYKYFEVI